MCVVVLHGDSLILVQFCRILLIFSHSSVRCDLFQEHFWKKRACMHALSVYLMYHSFPFTYIPLSFLPSVRIVQNDQFLATFVCTTNTQKKTFKRREEEINYKRTSLYTLYTHACPCMHTQTLSEY